MVRVVTVVGEVPVVRVVAVVPFLPILGDPGAVSQDGTTIGTGVKFSSRARRAPGNIPLTDEFQNELNSDFLIGRKCPQLSFFRPIREPHTVKSEFLSFRTKCSSNPCPRI